MEAHTLAPPTAAPAAGPLRVVRRYLDRYGLIAALAALPVYYAVKDLTSGYPVFTGGRTVVHHDLAYLGGNLVQGISNGSIWALIAIGYTLVYGIIELINFAHGEVFMIGSFTAASIWGSIGLGLATGPLGLAAGLALTLVVAMVVSGSLNVLIERVAYRPLRNAPKLAALITAVGFTFILQNVGLLWRGGSPTGVDDLIQQGAPVLTVAGITIRRADVLAVGVTIPLVFALTWFISRTRMGRAMRATAQDPEAARLMGINVDRTISVTFLLGGMLAVLGGLIIGGIQQLSDARIGPQWTPAVVFAYLIMIMVLRPRGLLGEETREAG